METAVRETSRSAFHAEQPAFKTMQDRIVHYMGSNDIRSRSEMAKDLGISTSTMSGRVNELIKLGKLRECAVPVTCRVSGRKVTGLQITR